MSMHDITRAELEEAKAVAGRWWLFLVSGIAWILFAFIVLSANVPRTVWAVAIYAGTGFIVGGVLELFMAAVVPSWKWLHVVFGVLAILAGLVAFVWPGETFLVLAAIIGWFVMFSGVFDIVGAFLVREFEPMWWLNLVVGIAQVLIGFWAVGYAGRSMALLVVWVAAAALARGISSLFLAFGLHRAGKEVGQRLQARPA